MVEGDIREAETLQGGAGRRDKVVRRSLVGEAEGAGEVGVGSMGMLVMRRRGRAVWQMGTSGLYSTLSATWKLHAAPDEQMLR